MDATAQAQREQEEDGQHQHQHQHHSNNAMYLMSEDDDDDGSFTDEEENNNSQQDLGAGETRNDQHDNNDGAGINDGAGNDPPAQPVQPAPAPVQDVDDEAMKLSPEEKQWAMELKQAVAENEDLSPITDFELTKFALIFKDDTQTAIRSIELGQEFRQCYGMDNSVEQGVHCLEAWMNQQPGFVLHLDVNDNHEAVKVIDAGVLNPKAALGNGGRNWRDFICGLYYFHMTAQPSFAAIRNGFTILLDFGDVDSSNMSLEVQYQFFAEMCRWYPYAIRAFMAFHTGFGATTRLSLLKAVMPKHVASKIQLGCEINDSDESIDPTMQRLRHFYLLPDLQGAQQHLLARARVILEYRAHNERIFTL